MAKQLGLFDGVESKANRNAALERVRLNAGAWFDCALAEANTIAHERPGELVSGEDLRFAITDRIGPPPNHHNTWGSLIRTLGDGRVLLKTTARTNMKDPRSNARETPLYRLNPQEER
jgi:hypothetical protein